MKRTEICLTARERRALEAIARERGITQGEVIREALHRYLAGPESQDWKSLSRRAREMGEDRTDLPETRALRREWDRLLVRG